VLGAAALVALGIDEQVPGIDRGLKLGTSWRRDAAIIAH
jgi:hypothetical protein